MGERGEAIRRDAAWALALLVAAAGYGATCVYWSAHPFEDAAILMRYAKHVAEGHGIVWNVGEAPVDGATDFLFMVVVAAGARLGGLVCGGGVSQVALVRGAVFAIAVGSAGLGVLAVYWGIRALHGSSRWVAAFSALYLAVGPALRYASGGFGTPFFALFVLGAWWLAYRLADGADEARTALGFALVCLGMGLTRPEGVFLALLMLAAVVYRRGWRGSRRAVFVFGAAFVVLGGAYFAWRWSYFGHPLPNPYYKKGGGAVHLDGLRSAVRYAAVFCLPFAPAFVAGLRRRDTAVETVFALIPLAGFVGLWLLVSDEGNVFGRLQYAVVPLVLLSWPRLVRGLGREWRLPRLSELGPGARRSLVCVATLVALMVLGYQHRVSRFPTRFRDGLYDVALMLRGYRDRGYTIAVTEAGLLPLYSQWRALDAWGLNDHHVAVHGLTEAHIDRYRPEVIQFHAYFSPLADLGRRDAWHAMCTTLKRYAESNGYVVAAIYGESPYDTHHYYVRPDFPHSEAIVRAIRGVDYSWMSSGRRCVNYALPLPPDER
ncbi:MAG: hypothetical protein ACLF0G_08070 [Candidatus Brocadiia bacterium]